MRMALLGAFGCGKSVTLKCIAGIMTPDRGHIILDGETIFDSEKHINLPVRHPLRQPCRKTRHPARE